MPTYEGLRLRFLKIKRKVFADWRKKQLIDTNFTIISNNCWGGMIYESYNLPKKSPTVGLFLMASDYIKFVSDLRGYINTDLTFISPEESKWFNYVRQDKRYGCYPVGLLKDIEIFFLHYNSEQEAKEKWEQRCKRINWDRMLVKFNDQNGCTQADVEQFMQLKMKNKLFFTCKEWEKCEKEKITIISQFPKHDYIWPLMNLSVKTNMWISVK